MEPETKGILPPLPEDRLIIGYGEPDADGKREDKTLFFSFLRQNVLLRFIEGPPQVINMRADPDLCEVVLKVLLAEKGGAGKSLDVELDEDAISGDDVDRVISWVQDHMTHFFMKRFQEMAQRAAALEPAAKALQSSALGSAPSGSPTASAGLSE